MLFSKWINEDKNFNEAKDLTRVYDGFYVLNTVTKEKVKYRYKKGVFHGDIEKSAFQKEAELNKQKPQDFIVHGFIKKGEY